MIIHFSGTGNSEFIACVLAERLNDIAADGAKLIKNGEKACFSSEKPYVFVCPVYSWKMPAVFEKLILDGKFDGNSKAYFIFTCGGDIGAAGNHAKKLCKKANLCYMGTGEIVMPDNYIIMFSPNSKDKDLKTIEKAKEKALDLARHIEAESELDKVKITPLGRLCSGIVNYGFNRFYVGAKKFYVTEKCISCGKCQELCMLNNISFEDGKPVWGKSCTHCMACISKCPTFAIEYGKSTVGRERYVFPEEKKYDK